MTALSVRDVSFLKKHLKERIETYGNYIYSVEEFNKRNPDSPLGGTDVPETQEKLRQVERILKKLSAK